MSFLSRLKPVSPPPPRPQPPPDAGVHARPPGHGAAPPAGSGARAVPPEDQQARRDPSGGNGQGLSVDSFDPDRVAMYSSPATATCGLMPRDRRPLDNDPARQGHKDPSGRPGGAGVVADGAGGFIRRLLGGGKGSDEAKSTPGQKSKSFL